MQIIYRGVLSSPETGKSQGEELGIKMGQISLVVVVRAWGGSARAPTSWQR